MPFVEHLGFRLVDKRDGTARVAYDPKPEHFNSWKAIHGGAVMSLLDVALSSWPAGRWTTTVLAA